MSAIFSKLISFFMAAIAFLFPWINIEITNADLMIDLRENPTTGYSWSCEIEDSSVLIMTDSRYEEDVHPVAMTGVGGTRYFYFDAVSQGETDITFVYSQPWDGGSIGDTVVYTVTVDADMNIEYVIN